MIVCCFTSFGFHIIELPQEMHQALMSYTDIAAIRNYKNTCKKLYENIHFHMASDYSIASMATVTCFRGLIAFAQQQDQMSVKEKDSPCDNIQKNFMRFLSRSGIKEYLATELVLQRIENRMTMFLDKKRLFSDISVEAGEQKALFQDNDAQDIATKLILYSQYYDPSSIYDNNKSPFFINMFNCYKKNLWPLLLAHPSFDVNLQDKCGYTALMTACTCNNIEAVKVLLADSRTDVNLQGTDGYTALMIACVLNNIKAVKELLADPRVDVNPQDKCGYTALMKACIHNNMEIVKELLADQKVDVNLQDRNGYTALMRACIYSNMEIVKQLLADQKIDVNLQDRWGDTALMTACAHNNKKAIKELLADQKVDVNLQDKCGETALITACCFNNMKAIKELLADPRVNINLQDKCGETALIKACTRKNMEAITELLSHPSFGVNLQDTDGDTALIKACNRNNREIASRIRAHERIGLMDKIMHTLYLNYGVSMVDVLLVVAVGSWCSALCITLVYLGYQL